MVQMTERNTFLELTDYEDVACRSSSVPPSWRVSAFDGKWSDVMSESTEAPDTASLQDSMFGSDHNSLDDLVKIAPSSLSSRAALYVPPTQWLKPATAFPEVRYIVEYLQMFLCSLTGVLDVQLQAAPMGSCTKLTVDMNLEGWHTGACEQCVLEPSRQALLEAVDACQNLWVLGYDVKPFQKEYDRGFTVTIGVISTQDESRMCWSFFQRGVCPRPGCCPWKHPDSFNLLELSVGIRA